MTHGLDHRFEGNTRLTGQLPGDSHAHHNAEPRRRRTNWNTPRVIGWLILAAVTLALWPVAWGGIIAFGVVDGRAMEPSYQSNDLVATLRHSTYAVGDVISYEVPAGQNGAGERGVHRIITVAGSGASAVFTTKGDNAPSADPWTFGATDVTGSVVLRIPHIGSVVGESSKVILGAVGGVGALVVLWSSRPGGNSAIRGPRRTTISSGF